MQKWKGLRVENETQFGRELQSFSKRNLREIVDSRWECGWSDGGCRIFAEALVHWGSGALELKAILHPSADGSWAADHVVAAFTSPSGKVFYLDAEGVADEDSLLRRWEGQEQHFGCKLGDFDYDVEEPPSGPPCDPDISERMSSKLTKKFGKFKPDLLLEVVALHGGLPPGRKVLDAFKNA